MIASKAPSQAKSVSSSTEFAVLRINVAESYVVAEWSRRLGCTPGELRSTAAMVGNVAADIEAKLRPAQHAGQEQQDAFRAALVDAPEPPVGMSIARDG